MDTLDCILKKFNLSGNEESPIQLKRFLRKDLSVIFSELGFKEGCEVGVLTGKHAREMIDANPNLHLHLVDCYYFYKEMPPESRERRMEDYLEEMRRRVAGCNFTEHIMFSMEAINEFEDESLDFVYIDSNHQFDFVMRDLIEWSRKVKIGGIVSGHDYKSQKTIGVNQAVNAYIEAHNIRPVFMTSKKRGHPNNTRTFFWVKE